MIQIFAGYDGREAVGYHTFCQSVLANASEPVSISPLHLPMFKKFYREGQRDGSNAFIYSRFLIPYLMGYKGWAIFADGSDMLCLGDIAELWEMRDPFKAVQVVQHDYKTKRPVKYIGTPMEAKNEDYPRKNWSSLMLINCAHLRWAEMTPATVAKKSGADLHRFNFIEDRFIGALPAEWNWLDEYEVNEGVKILHYTTGIPAIPEYAEANGAAKWRATRDAAMYVQLGGAFSG